MEYEVPWGEREWRQATCELGEVLQHEPRYVLVLPGQPPLETPYAPLNDHNVEKIGCIMQDEHVVP